MRMNQYSAHPQIEVQVCIISQDFFSRKVHIAKIIIIGDDLIEGFKESKL